MKYRTCWIWPKKPTIVKTVSTVVMFGAMHSRPNLPEPDSRILPHQKTFVQGYNAQVAVDSAHQIIVAADVSNTATDDVHLPVMVARLPKNPKALSTDAGYTTPENIRYLKRKRYDA